MLLISRMVLISASWVSLPKRALLRISEWPAVNCYIDADELIYHDYADISIAVSTPRGLTVPVMRNVESLSMADIEKKVVELAGKARDNKLTMEELQGGTFTITNGGVFGSLRAPRSSISLKARSLVCIKYRSARWRSMARWWCARWCTLALSYDHRVIDGRESVFPRKGERAVGKPGVAVVWQDPVGLARTVTIV